MSPVWKSQLGKPFTIFLKVKKKGFKLPISTTYNQKQNTLMHVNRIRCFSVHGRRAVYQSPIGLMASSTFNAGRAVTGPYYLGSSSQRLLMESTVYILPRLLFYITVSLFICLIIFQDIISCTIITSSLS